MKQNPTINDGTPTAFIVDDDSDVCAAIALLMSSVGIASESYGSAWAYLSCFNPRRPGCLILDVRMPDMSGLELQDRLAEQPIHPPVVIITGHGDVPMAVRAVKHGAVDFLEKPFNDSVLLEAVQRAIALDAEQRGRLHRQTEVAARLERLTRRERQILDLIVAGKRNKVIAADLEISQSTVEAHRAKIMDKLEARSLSDLMRLMLRVDED